MNDGELITRKKFVRFRPKRGDDVDSFGSGAFESVTKTKRECRAQEADTKRPAHRAEERDGGGRNAALIPRDGVLAAQNATQATGTEPKADDDHPHEKQRRSHRRPLSTREHERRANAGECSAGQPRRPKAQVNRDANRDKYACLLYTSDAADD